MTLNFQGHSQDFFSTKAKETSARRAEVRGPRAESGVGFLGRGQPAPSLPARGSGERYI